MLKQKVVFLPKMTNNAQSKNFMLQQVGWLAYRLNKRSNNVQVNLFGRLSIPIRYTNLKSLG